MSAYFSLNREVALLLAGLLFLSSVSELALGIYRYVRTGDIKKSLAAGCVFLILVTSVSVLAGGKGSYPERLPWLIYLAAGCVFFIHSGFGIVKEYKADKNSLSPDSVRQAINSLNSGICFTDEFGRIILINRIMNDLVFSLCGRYPQTSDEIYRALNAVCLSGALLKNEQSAALYRTYDKRVWKLSVIPIDEARLEGFVQITAHDMTDLYDTNDKLEKENATLRFAIIKMKDTIVRMSEIAREQETLELKMRIHNDIGASLIALSDLVTADDGSDAKAQVNSLKRALSYFSARGNPAFCSMDDLDRFADECGVRLNFEGDFPEDGEIRDIIAASVRECITNCARHAKGTVVNVKSYHGGEAYKVNIINDGEPPKNYIVEGGGLSTLRRKVEAAGGVMEVKSRPRFYLNLVLTERK